MRAVVQRVSEARVTVDGAVVGEVRAGAPGLLVLLGAGHGDGEAQAVALADKICGLRVFEDDVGKMNLGLGDVGGSLLVVSQFTLYGDCRRGRRPSFTRALEPERAARLLDAFVERARRNVRHVAVGRFGAHMEVALVNDGPVTLWLDTDEL